MDVETILRDLRQQVNRLDAAISALEGGVPRHGRPSKASRVLGAEQGTRRHMSIAARGKIAAAQRARWGKRKGRPPRP